MKPRLLYFGADTHNARTPPHAGNVHYASRRSLVSLRIRRTSRVIRTLLSGLNVNLSAVSAQSHERIRCAMRLNAHGRFADCAGTRCFLHTGRYFRTSTGGEPDGRRLALSEISRCRPHKSTVDTAVGRVYALTRVERGFGRVPPRLVSSSPTALPSAPLRSAPLRSALRVGTVYIY